MPLAENYVETVHGGLDFEVNPPYLMYTHGDAEVRCSASARIAVHVTYLLQGQTTTFHAVPADQYLLLTQTLTHHLHDCAALGYTSLAYRSATCKVSLVDISRS